MALHYPYPTFPVAPESGSISQGGDDHHYNRLGDGYQTLLSFADPSTYGTGEQTAVVAFWEREVTPPGIDGGDAVENTTMHNQQWRTMNPRHLKTLTESSINAAYDPAIYVSILSIINANTSVTVWFPDHSYLCFWGYLKSFEPGPLAEGKMPECAIKVTPTNHDNEGNECAPIYQQNVGSTNGMALPGFGVNPYWPVAGTLGTAVDENLVYNQPTEFPPSQWPPVTE